MVLKLRRSNMGLSARLILSSVLLVSLSAIAVGFLAYRGLEEIIVPNELSRLETVTRRRADELDAFAQDARAEVLSVCGSAPVDGITRAAQANGFDSKENSSMEQWKQRLSHNFTSILNARPSYHQFRLIGVADGGREIVRVDRMGPDNTVRIVPESELQQKGDRPYVKEALALSKGEVYVSSIELNQEFGKVQSPHVPVMRIATPVVDEAGELFGVLVINIDMRPILQQTRERAAPGALLFVVDSAGSYLVHPDPKLEFGVDLGHESTWKRDFVSIASQINPEHETVWGVMGDGINRMYSVGAPVRINGSYIAVIQRIPHATLIAPAEAVQKAGMYGGLGAVVIAILIAVMIARSQIKPLEELATAILHFDGEEKIKVPTSAAGEIGALARSFEEMMTDIQDKTTTLRNLYEMERLHGAVVDSSSEAIITVDLTGSITGWNPAAESMFGYSAEEAIGQPATMLAPEERKHEILDEIKLVSKGQRPERTETVRLNKLGQQIEVSATIFPVYDDDAKVACYSKMLRDVTEQRKLENRLRLAQKMEAMGTLAGGIAHDFNNILTAITGNVKLAQDDLPFDHSVQRDLSEIEKAATRGASVVRQILRISRPEGPKSEPVDIPAAIDETVDFLRATKPDNIEIDTRFDPNLPAVLGDSTEIHQVVMNLAVNAFHAMKETGGRLEVRGTLVTLDEVAAGTFPNLTPGRFIRLSFSDTGKGMDGETLQRIFEPFFTTKGNGEGTGLGLSIVYGIVERHGGAITAYSEIGKGTMFRIYLPALASSAPSAHTEDDKIFRGSGESIMYVDDDEALVLMITRMLRKLNYEVAGYVDPQEALKVFLTDPNRFDVVVTDMSMPHIDGPEFVRQLQAVRPDVPVVMVTGYIRPEDIERTGDLGIRKLVLKPNTVQDMGQVLYELLEELRLKQQG